MDILDYLIHVSTSFWVFVVVTHVYRSLSSKFIDHQTWVCLVIVDMLDFDVILGMNWLSPYNDVLNCNAKTIIVEIPGRTD